MGVSKLYQLPIFTHYYDFQIVYENSYEFALNYVLFE